MIGAERISGGKD